jgi:methylated-DNA-[protein]-cysteine S-methyltransferase
MSKPVGIALFDTAIGRCAIAWSDAGIRGVQLPEARPTDTLSRVQRRFTGATVETPPERIAAAIDAIAAFLETGRLDDGNADLSSIALDMDGVPVFHRRVDEVARTIPPGQTLAYGEIAARLGEPGTARAVGAALGRNPFAIVVPCHRVLAANGKIGGFSAGGGIATKLKLLSRERARAVRGDLFDGNHGFAFDPDAAIATLTSADPGLARLIDAVGPFRMELKAASSVFAALAEAIVYQQLSGRAAETIFARVRALFPRGHEGPTPEQILRAPEAKLRGAGLSQSKFLSLRDLAKRTVAGELPTLGEIGAMDDETVIEKLTEVRGIGRWTAEMLLMFRLGRPDVLPIDDYGIRKGFAVAFKKKALPEKSEVERRGRRWQPYRTVASWYLWRAAERSTEER